MVYTLHDPIAQVYITINLYLIANNNDDSRRLYAMSGGSWHEP
jgi:hypothetical protein